MPQRYNMSLTYEEIERHILKISTGKEIISVIRQDGSKLVLMLKTPISSMLLEANHVYDTVYEEAINEGLLPIKELDDLILKRNLFTEKDRRVLESLKSRLEGQEALLYKTTKVKAKSDRIKKIILDIKKDIIELQNKKSSKLLLSAETKADEDKHSFLCFKCVFNLDNTTYWSSLQAALSDTNIEVRTQILYKFLRFYNGVDVRIARELARSNIWRIRYINSCKAADPLFDVPSAEYSNDQLNLVYWSNFYSNIYEMMPEDRPSETVIEDDDALDAYMNSYYQERNKENAARRSKKVDTGRLSAFDKEEVIVTQSNELYEDIDYDKPREAQRLKDKTDIKKRTLRG